MYTAGVDIGSTQSKAVIIDDKRNIVGRALINTGVDLLKTGEKAYRTALDDAKLSPEQVKYIVGTGYGRYKITFGNAQVTEIGCHARGASLVFPQTRTVLDIGGQDTKAIKVGVNGEVLDFSMNDKCAAGTGRFLAAAAYVLDIPLDKIGEVSLTSNNPVRISSTCTVFAESEIVSHLARGKKPEDILNGMHAAIANRCLSLLSRVGVAEELTFTGGVSKNRGMVAAMQKGLGIAINVSPDSHFMGAIGAAVFALERAQVAIAI